MTCKIAMDLSELYKANLVSEESAREIRAHLKTCAACRKYYRDYDILRKQSGTASHPAVALEGTEERLYADLSRRLRRRRFFRIVSTSAAIGAGSIMLTVGLLLMSKSVQLQK